MRTTGFIYDPEGRPAASILEDNSVWSDEVPARLVGHVRGLNIYNLADELVGHLTSVGEPDGSPQADLAKLLGE